jgi:hypothetical protein
VRTIPMPAWTKNAIDAWMSAAGVTEGHLFRPVNRGDQVFGDRLSEKFVWQMLKTYIVCAGLPAIAPHDPDPLLSKEELDKQNDIWINVLQAEEARLSTRGKQVVVRDSGHTIPYERPTAVVSAIREVWTALQKFRLVSVTLSVCLPVDGLSASRGLKTDGLTLASQVSIARFSSIDGMSTAQGTRADHFSESQLSGRRSANATALGQDSSPFPARLRPGHSRLSPTVRRE